MTYRLREHEGVSVRSSALLNIDRLDHELLRVRQKHQAVRDPVLCLPIHVDRCHDLPLAFALGMTVVFDDDVEWLLWSAVNPTRRKT